MAILASNIQVSVADPRHIVIRRDTRQRQREMTAADVEDMKQSLVNSGFINPIVVRDVDGDMVLVAGERRLTAALSLGLTEVPVRLFSNLTATEAEVIELEENIKRKELYWRDNVRAVGRLHQMKRTEDAKWRVDDTAALVALHPAHVRKILHVFDNIDSPKLSAVEGIEQAYNTLHRFAERKAADVVAGIIANGAEIFGEKLQGNQIPQDEIILDDFEISKPPSVFDEAVPPPAGEAATSGAPVASPTPAQRPAVPAYIPPTDPIICANVLDWLPTYTGPKFSLIHCDFPYGNYKGDDSSGSMAGVETENFYDNHEEIYWTLLSALTANLDRIMSYSAHMVFWFNMNFYTETVKQLRATGLMVHDHPLVWHKTPGGGGGLGVVPGTATTYPRRTYDTALLAVRGNRPLAKPGMNSYAAPTVGNKIHPSQKPEPMLRHFLSMVVDETTTVFDPTCGSGAALRAAEDLGAKGILGVEMDPNYAKSALARTLQARVMRQAGQFLKSES